MAEAQRIVAPTATQPLLVAGEQNLMEPSWYRWAVAVSGRRAAFVSSLAASPTVEQISTQFNALLTALQNADLQETS